MAEIEPDDSYYDEKEVSLEKLQKTVDMLTQLMVRQQRVLILLENEKNFGSPPDPSLFPKYSLNGLTLSWN